MRSVPRTLRRPHAQHGRGNPVSNNDPTGHDPLDTQWRNDFSNLHGRDPDAADEAIRLFMLAYPDEASYSTFYDANGNRIDNAQFSIFVSNVPEGRNWNTLGDALSRLATWYLAGEESMFIQDITFLFAGTPSRSQPIAEPNRKYWSFEPGYQGNIHLHIKAGTLDPKFYTNNPSIPAPNDADMNVHHWAWGVALGYNVGPMWGAIANTGREIYNVKGDRHKVNMSDVYIGNAGVLTGTELWYYPNDISASVNRYLGITP